MANITLSKPSKKDGLIHTAYIKIYLYTDESGARYYNESWKVPEGVTTPKAIRKKAAEYATILEHNIKGGMESISRKTFEEFSAEVMEIKRDSIKHRTYMRYIELLERINAEIGYRKMKDITAYDLNSFYKKLSKPGQNKNDPSKGLSPKTILEHHRLIDLIYEEAIRKDIVTVNVAKKADPPKVVTPEKESFTKKELLQILEALNKAPLKWQAITRLLIDTGARRGEIMALKWENVDLENNTIHICLNLQYSKDRGVYLETPKTKKSIRTIAISPKVSELLKQLKHEQNLEMLKNRNTWKNLGFCFTKEDGTNMHPDSPTDWMKKFYKKNNLPHMNPHKFRHSMISLMLNEGIPVNVIAGRAGHSKTSTTLDIYAHVIPGADVEACSRYADMLYMEG